MDHDDVRGIGVDGRGRVGVGVGVDGRSGRVDGGWRRPSPCCWPPRDRPRWPRRSPRRSASRPSRGRTTIVNVRLAPSARSPSGKESLPSLGVTPPVAETNAAPAGSASVSVALRGRGRAPVGHGDGEGDVVRADRRGPRRGRLRDRQVGRRGRRCGKATVVVAVSVSLAGSLSVNRLVETEAESAIVEPSSSPGSTRTTSVKTASAPPDSASALAETVPVPPAAGVLAAQPAGAVNETKVVPAGMASTRPTPEAASGPSLVTVIV